MTRIDAIASVLGYGAIVYGVAHWSPAAAWIVFGLGLVAVAIWPTPRRDRR